MEQTIRRVLALVPVLMLAAGVGVAARSTTSGGDHGGNICVIAGDIVACAPPNDAPS